MSANLKVSNPYKKDGKIHHVPPFMQLGPGPCNSSLAVMNALMNQPLAFSNEYFYQLLDEIQEMVKYLYQTKNPYTVVAQYSGNGGNEALVINLANPGDTIMVAVAGIWGIVVADMGRRYNLNVVELEIPPGEVYTLEELEKQIIKHKPVTLFVTHGESSGGTLQPLDGLSEICHKYDCLLAVDAVISVGVIPLLVDEWQIDAVNGATQKGLGAPAGMSLITLSDRAYERMLGKKSSVPYIHDLQKLGDFWNCYGRPRKYIYTYGVHMLFCVRQTLIEICEEGLENVWARHQRVSDLFISKLSKLGMKHLIEKPENRFSGMNCVSLPEGIHWELVLDYSIQKYNIEFGFGVGPTRNKALRISFLAQNAQPEVVEHFVKVLEEGIEYSRNNVSKLETCSVSRCMQRWDNLAGYPEK